MGGAEQIKERGLKGFLVMMAIAGLVSMARPAEAKEVREGSDFDYRPVKTSVFQAIAGPKSTDEWSDSNFLHSLSENEKYQEIRDKILEAKKNLAEKNLYLEHGGLFYNPQKGEPENWEIGINPKKGFQAEFEKTSKNKETKVNIDLGKEKSIQFTKMFNLK